MTHNTANIKHDINFRAEYRPLSIKTYELFFCKTMNKAIAKKAYTKSLAYLVPKNGILEKKTNISLILNGSIRLISTELKLNSKTL